MNTLTEAQTSELRDLLQLKENAARILRDAKQALEEYEYGLQVDQAAAQVDGRIEEFLKTAGPDGSEVKATESTRKAAVIAMFAEEGDILLYLKAQVATAQLEMDKARWRLAMAEKALGVDRDPGF